MFTTFKQKLLLGIYIFVLLSIPIGSYLISESKILQSRASEEKPKTFTSSTPKPVPSPAKNLLNLVNMASDSASHKEEPSPSPSPESPTIATSFGPTLALTALLEGRPKGNQAGKVFVGIAEGIIGQNPKFLLSFTIDLPASGKYAGLSLAGLNTGSTYSALIKGTAQIAKAVSFTMSPTVTRLNNDSPLDLTSGDLNDDNAVNSADYVIAQKALGATIRSTNWNENADLNKDGIINTLDLGIISKNNGKTGDSGAWTSPLVKIATPSGSLNEPEGGPSAETGGYWLWMPK